MVNRFAVSAVLAFGVALNAGCQFAASHDALGVVEAKAVYTIQGHLDFVVVREAAACDSGWGIR
jgi:hypothetical protein